MTDKMRIDLRRNAFPITRLTELFFDCCFHEWKKTEQLAFFNSTGRVTRYDDILRCKKCGATKIKRGEYN